MQISNPILYQFIGTTLNREQSVNRLPARPVTIEGQLVDDDEKKKSSQPDSSGNDTTENFALDKEQQQLIRPVAEPLQNNDVSTIQKNQAENFADSNPTLFNTSALSAATQSATGEQGFPLGSRKSFQGTAGNSLIIQNYLNNTPEQLNRASDINSASVDYFV